MVRLRRQFRFEAAHYLPTFPEGHKCRRMHGHSFRVDVVVEGEVETDKGYLMDYGTVGELCEPVRRQLDHYLLNEIEGLENPTAENLARWVWERLAPAVASAAVEGAPREASGLRTRPTATGAEGAPGEVSGLETRPMAPTASAAQGAARDTARGEEEGHPPTALPRLVEVVVHETCTNACHYRGE